MSDCEVRALWPKLSNFLGLILYFFVLVRHSKPEVSEDVAEHQFSFSLVHLEPPYIPPRAQRSPPGHPQKS